MSLLPFGVLPPAKPRRFLPRHLDLGDWNLIEPWFDRLDVSGREADTSAALERWLLDWGELSAALDEEGNRRYIAMTCHTDHPDAERGYLHYIQEIEPRTKPRHFTLNRLYLSHPRRRDLARTRFEVYDRNTQVQVDIYREENVPLETEENRLGQQYQKLMGSLTVPFRGEERTLVHMSRYLEEPDRATRQEAWDLVARRRLAEAAQLEALFDELFALRQRMARNAGFEHYRDYAFKRLGRFDYTADDCLRFHDAIEAEVVPLFRDLHERRRTRLNLDSLRPWDVAVDPLLRPPLRPFTQVEEMIDRSQRIFDRMDPGLATDFRTLQQHRLLDLDNRKGKAPGGYQCALPEARLPFIFMNAVGVQRDVETMLHEAGHAFHALATAAEDFYPYRSAVPTEFCEVASMGMELLGLESVGEFYTPEDARRARCTHLEGIVGILPWIASVDAFQHQVYTHPQSSPADRRGIWLDLMRRFGGAVDWSGLEEAQGSLWHRQLHLYVHPFYYIEYGIAQLGALQLWVNARRNRASALAAYRRALALGGSRPLPELFAAAGCRLDFSAAALRPLLKLIADELGRLDEG
jgi:oligoendopeptidase F